jgi:L-iditol 2-dehydrogenase
MRGGLLMKAAVFHGKFDVKVEEVPKPELKPDEVLIKVEACGVCGTDLHIYEGAEGAAKTVPPTILGHEFSGTVCEVGSDVKSIKVGQRVCVDPNDMCGKCYYCRNGQAHFCENMIGYGTTVNGGFAEYCAVREKQVYVLPEHLSFEEGAMAEPVACCLHGLDLAGVKPGHTVMLFGGGPIGLIMLQLVKISGAARIILVEPIAEKRELGIKLGADIAIDPFNESIDSVLKSNSIENIDVTIECVGLKSTMLDAIKYTGRGGTAMLFGLTEPNCEIPLKPFDVFKREITIKASFINPYTQKRAVDLLSTYRIDVSSLISDVVSIDNINEVFETKKYRGRGKVVIKP